VGPASASSSAAVIEYSGDGLVAYVLLGLVVLILLGWPRPFRP
jgi:hypothetical protein